MALRFDAGGNLFISDVRIRKVTPAGVISIVAGNGTSGSAEMRGPATSASIDPVAFTIDAGGNLFIAEPNGRIRKGHARRHHLHRRGIVSSPGIAGWRPGHSASFYYPTDVAADAAGNLFITDRGNHAVRKVTPAGIISTVAGNGSGSYSGDRGAATSATLSSPEGVAVDAAGNVFIADSATSEYGRSPLLASSPPSRQRIAQLQRRWRAGHFGRRWLPGGLSRWTRPAISSSPIPAATASARSLPPALSPLLLAMDLVVSAEMAASNIGQSSGSGGHRAGRGRKPFHADSGNNRIRKVTAAGIHFPLSPAVVRKVSAETAAQPPLPHSTSNRSRRG